MEREVQPPTAERPEGLPVAAHVQRDHAVAALCRKLTELAEIGRHYLTEAIEEERRQAAEAERRRAERISRASRRGTD